VHGVADELDYRFELILLLFIADFSFMAIWPANSLRLRLQKHFGFRGLPLKVEPWGTFIGQILCGIRYKSPSVYVGAAGVSGKHHIAHNTMTEQGSAVEDQTSPVDVAQSITGSDMTSSSSIRAGFYFECAVVFIGVVGTAANAPISKRDFCTANTGLQPVTGCRPVLAVQKSLFGATGVRSRFSAKGELAGAESA